MGSSQYFPVLDTDDTKEKMKVRSLSSPLSQSPEVQVQVLGLQDVHGRPHGPDVNGALGGSVPGRGRIRSGEDVVNAEFDLRLWFPVLGWVRDEVVLPGAGPRPLGVQRADGGGGLGPASRGRVPIAVAFRRVEERRLFGIPEADLHVPPAPAPPEVAVFKQVEH